jgi:hypothetical protein
MILCVRRGVLKDLKDEISPHNNHSENENENGNGNGSQGEGPSGSRSRSKSRSGSRSIEMGDLYRSNDDDIVADTIPTTDNPMHTAALELVRQKEGELFASNQELEATKAENEELRREIDLLRQQQHQPIETL